MTILDSRRAAILFWLIAAAHTFFWVWLPWAIQPSPATYDTVEAIALGREWVLGTTKHPTLPFWFLESVIVLTGGASWGCYLASQLCVVLGLWSVWRLGREFLSEPVALVSVLAVTTYRYFNIGSLNYTVSLPVVSLWCFAITIFYLALKNNRRRDWVMLGVALGAGMLSKYSFTILIVTMLSWMAVSASGRRAWRTPGPWLTTLVAFIVFLPHLLWVLHHTGTTLSYAAGSSSSSGGSISWYTHIVAPTKFFVAQVPFVLPILIALVPLTGFAWQYRYRWSQQQNWQNWFLTFMIAVPVLLHLLACALGWRHFRPAYGSPLWTLIGIWVLAHLEIAVTPLQIRRACQWSLGVIATTVLCYLANYEFAYWATPNEGCRIHFPATTLAAKVSEAWHERYATPCRWLSGDWKLTAHAAFRMPERPRVLCYYDGLAPGQHTVSLAGSDADINRDGGVILWTSWTDWGTWVNAPTGAEMPTPIPDWLLARYPRAEILPVVWELPWQTETLLSNRLAKLLPFTSPFLPPPSPPPPPLRVRYAIVPPAA